MSNYRMNEHYNRQYDEAKRGFNSKLAVARPMPNASFTEDTDNIYYNISIRNETNKIKRATFSENRVSAILENPNNYEMAVIRFSIPATAIPILFFRNGTFPLQDNVPNTGYKYFVALEYDGEIQPVQLEFLPNEIGEALYKKDTVWNYQEVLDSMNIALALAFAALKLAKPAAPPTAPPRMIYDPTTRLFSLYAEQLYDIYTDTIKIYINGRLQRLFSSMQYVYEAVVGLWDPLNPEPEGRYQLLPKDNGNNSITYNATPYFVMTGENDDLYLWSDFDSLEFETSSIPVEPEYIGAQKNIIARVITDFEPLSSDPSREKIQFYPQGPLRFYDMKSSYPMNQMDINVVWRDRFKNPYPIYLKPGELLTCKILFRKRSDKVLRELLRRNEESFNS